jgi:hypothetical protein
LFGDTTATEGQQLRARRAVNRLADAGHIDLTRSEVDGWNESG